MNLWKQLVGIVIDQIPVATMDDIPESEPESCGHEGEGNEDEDDGDDEDEEDDEEDEEEEEDDENEDDDDEEDDEEDEEEDEDEEVDDEDEDEEIQDPNEVTGNFLLDSNSSRNLTALFAANEKAPVLRHATHAIDETKQALTKMRCANSPRDKTIFSRTLIAACTDNDVNTVRRLLGKGNVNINESTDDGESLLSMACSAGYYELAQVLLAMSAAQVEDKGQKDCTPLMEAASAGHLEIVKLLLSHNADVNAHCATGNTPLMFACAGGHVEVVQELLKHGANVEEQNENGHTPLMEAASAGHVEVAKVLLEHGAGINTHSNEFKESALTLACYKGHLNMVRFLLQAGADQEHKTDEMHTALMEASMDGHVEVARLLLDSGAQVNMPTDSFESPLTLAACGGHVELATLLIERGANIEEVNDEGYTPLMEAAREGHEEMVALLLSKGANINATTEETQETALTLACCGGFSEVAEFLIKEGANLELGASTPLMEAAQEGHTDLVRFLLQNKANVHAETQTGDTALTHACENGHTDAAEVLLSYGAELEHESEGGRTPLMKACRAGHVCTVRFLISKGANVNKQTSSNDHTPLSLACAGGHQTVVELLLKSGADPFHKLKDNSTMLIEAAKGGHTRVVELLFKYPHFMQNHQNELQAAVNMNGALPNGSNAGQLRYNLQPQKQVQQQQKTMHQQLQQQLQHLSAPPGLHEVTDATRASNQQLFHQQQFNGNVATGGTVSEYLDEKLQLAASNGVNDDFAAIDINSLSAQQQEALIAKSRLFHLQAGFEQGLTQGLTREQQHQQQPLVQSNISLPRKVFELDMAHINSLTPPQKAPPAPPVLPINNGSQQQQQQQQHQQQQQQQQQQQPQPTKVKGSVSRKNRQPPAPFDLNLPIASGINNTADQQQLKPEEIRSQPLGDDGSGAAQSKQFSNLNEDEHRYFMRRRVFMQDFKKQTASENKVGTPSLTSTNYINEENVDNLVTKQIFATGTSFDPHDMSLLLAGNTAGAITDANATVVSDLPQQQQQHHPQQQQQLKSSANANTQSATGNTRFVNKSNNPATGSTKSSGTQITTPSEVSQSTAISDRPKAKPVSKKDGKNFRKTAFTQLPVLQQNQMVSIYNNLPLLITNESKPSLHTQQAIMNHMMFAAQQHQQQHQQQPYTTGLDSSNIVVPSNSPESPLSSPQSSCSTLIQQPPQSPDQFDMPNDNSNNIGVMQQQQQPQPQLSTELSIPAMLRNQKLKIGAQELQSALEAACSRAATAVTQDARSAAETIELLNASKKLDPDGGAVTAATAIATACGMNGAEQQEYLKKLDVNTQMKLLHEGWQLFGIRRFFEDQPKSPTEAPPEKDKVYIDNRNTTAATSSEMKNLATLCSAAAAVAPAKESKKRRSAQNDEEYANDGDDEGESVSPPEPTSLNETENDEEEDDDIEDGEEAGEEGNDGDGGDIDGVVPIRDADDDDEEDQDGDDENESVGTVDRNEETYKKNAKNFTSGKFKASDAALHNALQQQFVQQQQKIDASKQDDSMDGAIGGGDLNVGNGEMYPALSEPLEQFDNDDDSAREQMYDIAVDMDEIFQVIHNVNDPSYQELNCAELADFGINSICKSRWNGNWAQTPKWTSQDQLIATHPQAMLPVDDQQNEQQRQANQLLLDYQLQHQLQQRFVDNEMQVRDQLQHQLQQTTVSLIPFSNKDAAAVAVTAQPQQLQQTLPHQHDFHIQQRSQQPLDLEPEQDLKQQIHQLQQLQHQQQSNTRLLKAVAAAAANQQQPQSPAGNYVFNVDGEKSAQALQLLFQIPPSVQQSQDPEAVQQLQHLQLHHQDLQDQQKQQEQQVKLLQQQQLQVKLLQQQQHQLLQDLSQQSAEGSLQLQHLHQQQHLQQQPNSMDVVAQNNMMLQQQALAQQVLNQQVLKQKEVQLHHQQQFLLQQQKQLQQQQQQQQPQQQPPQPQQQQPLPQQQQACSQHTQVQVAIQTQPPNVASTNTPRGSGHFCPSIPLAPDVGLSGICALSAQQQQQQQMVAAAAAAQQLPTPAMTSTGTSTKMSGGIAKKAIDKQSRKDRNRYSLLRQTPAGSQANTTLQQQQQYQQAVAATTIDKTIDVDSETDSNHDTALTLACAGGHEELVELLISRGANIEHRDKKGFTPLILAATAGHEKVVDILLKNGAELEAQSERTKDTPLSLACSGGRYEVVELLLSMGANKEHRNVSDYTPLSLAASGGYVNIIKLLLSNGAEINSRTGSKLGISPLMLAAMNGHTAAVKLLLDQGSDINAQIETNRNTALTLACFQGRHEVVSLLLDRKANVEHRAKTGLTPLMEAASGGYIEVGRVLLDKGADVNAAPVPTSRDTALTIAADKGHLKFVELLLSRGASVEVKNKKGNSPLWLAAHGGHLSVVETLYNHNADIDSQDNRRVSCLMAAFRKGHTKVVKWMVQYVTQFPSDQEMNRFISTISDKELSEKCYDCMKFIRAAKEAQAVKANKNASILLEELDMERTREESRRAAAARRRERKKKKKMEKKEEKRRQMEGSNGEPLNGDDVDGKESDKDDDSDKEENAEEDEENQIPQNYREEGDSGIDQGSCSSTDVKGGNAVPSEKGAKNKNKKKKNSQVQPQQPQLQPTPPPLPPPATNQSQANVSTHDTRNNSPVVEEVPTKSTSKQTKKDEQQATKGAKKVASVANAEATSNAKTQSANAVAVNKKTELSNKKDDNAVTKKKDANKQKENDKQHPKETPTAKQHHQSQQPLAEKQKSDKSNDTVSNNAAQSTNQSTGGGNRKSLVFSASRNANNVASDDSKKQDDTTATPRDTTTSKSVPPKRGEDGWKEVVRKSSTQQSSAASSTNTSTASTASTATATVPEMTCKKVQVPVNAISRVIGRAGSNINAIRATTGAHIEVEKQGKNQSERSITIKGLTDATKQAHMLILALIKDPDVDILQMLPHINTSIKASSLPMTVGTWDNKTAMQSSSSSSSTSSTPAATATTTNQSGNSANNAGNTASAASSSTSLAKPGTASGKHGNASQKPQHTTTTASTTSSSKTSTGRAQSTKPFYGQQTTPRSSNATHLTAANSSSSQKYKSGQDSATSVKSSTTSYTSAVLSQKNSNTKQQTTTFTNSGSALNAQTFAAKLTGSAQAIGTLPTDRHASPKKSEGRSGTTAPYGRGKPVASSTPALSQIGGAGSGSSSGTSGSGNGTAGSTNNHNTLAGPIGTFNVAEVANMQSTSATNATTTRSVTPIGPPNKRIQPTPPPAPGVQNIQSNQSQPLQNNAVQQGLQQTKDTIPQVQNLENMMAINVALSELSSTVGTGANNSTTGVGVGAPAFGSQLTNTITNEYTLFNDNTSFQSKWGDSSQIYNAAASLVNDTLPKADASKAPGYNRNILTSPVNSSKASSAKSSSPGPILPVPIGTQPSNATHQNLNILRSGGANGGGSVVRSPGLESMNDSAAISAMNAKSPPAPQVGNGSGDATAISPGVIKPPGQPTSNNSQPSGLTIQRPNIQHRTGNVNSNSVNTGQTSPVVPSLGQMETSAINFGPIGSNAGGRPSGPGAVNEQSMNRFYDHLGTTVQPGPHQMNFHVEQSTPHVPPYSTASATSGSHPISRLNPRASSFSQGNKAQQAPQQQAIGTGMYHQQQQQQQQQQQTNNNYNTGKPMGSGTNLAPGRPQSQPQGGQCPNQRWYGAGNGNDFLGYVPNARDMLNLENGMPGVIGTGNSPAAMSPNQGGNLPAGGIMQVQQPQQLAQQQQEDLRKMPRPIGTERASWKYNNYPNMNNAGTVSGLNLDDTIAAMSAANSATGGLGAGAGPIPPWMLEKPQTSQHQQQQHSNWMKQQYRYYSGPATTITSAGNLGVTQNDYHLPQEPHYHMPLDYHTSMPVGNMNQNHQMNMVPPFPGAGYPQFMGGNTGGDVNHMTDKAELWDHYDKHAWPTNWTN